MTDKPIDLQAVRERLKDEKLGREIDADQDNWEDARNRLIEVMLAADLSTIGLTSATLRALLDILVSSDVELEEAKKSVTRCLNAFFEREST